MNKDTPKGKGIRTAFQAIAGTIVAFLTGLWAIPEVKLYVDTFARTEGLVLIGTLLGMVGVSAGLIAFIQNKLGK